MINNDIRTDGSGHYKQRRGGAGIIEGAVLGVVKNNIDPTHSGKIDVYVPSFGSNRPDDPNSWRLGLRPISPWYGSGAKGGPREGGDKTGVGNFGNNPQSYGFASSSPDVGSTVLCIFVEGKPDHGFYLGTVAEVGLQHMIPAVGAAATTVIPNDKEAQLYGGAERLPASEPNFANPAVEKSSSIINEPKPIHSDQAGILSKQGILRDNIRGVISSSAQRQTPSTVFGFSTAGRPIYQGGYTDEMIKQAINSNTDPIKFEVVGRTGGHSFVLDDGTIDGQDQLIRLRTSTGHQILMSDSGQSVFIIHANGESWFELGKEGTIDMYATNSVNIRTKGDLNLHADRDVNINAARNLNLYGERTQIESGGSTTHRVGANYAVETEGDFTVKSSGSVSMDGSKVAAITGGFTFINGKKILLNSGTSPLKPPKITPVTKTEHKDSSYSQKVGWIPVSDKPLVSFASRVPAHQPWVGNGTGIDLRLDQVARTSAVGVEGSVLPIISQALVAASGTVPSGPLTNPSLFSSIPSLGSVLAKGGFNILDPNTTRALISQNLASFTVPGLKPPGLVEGTTVTYGMASNAGPASIYKPGFDEVAQARIDAGYPEDQIVAPSNYSTSAVTSPDEISLERQGEIFSQVAGEEASKLADYGLIDPEAPATANAGLTNGAALYGADNVAAVVEISQNQGSEFLGSTDGGFIDFNRGKFSKFLKKLGKGLLGVGLTAITGGIGAAIAGGSFAAAAATSFIGGATKLVTSTISNTISGAINSVTGAVSGAVATVASAFTGITGNISSLFTKLSSFSISNVVNQLQSGAQQLFRSVESSYGSMTPREPNQLSSSSPFNQPTPDIVILNQKKEQAQTIEDAARDERNNFQTAYFSDPTGENQRLLIMAENKLNIAIQRRAAAEQELRDYSGSGSSSGLTVNLTNGRPSILSLTSTIGKIVNNITNPTQLLSSLSGNLIGKMQNLAGSALSSVSSFVNSFSSALGSLGGTGSKVRSATQATNVVNNARINSNTATAIHSSGSQIQIPKSVSNKTTTYVVSPDENLRQQVSVLNKMKALNIQIDQLSSQTISDPVADRANQEALATLRDQLRVAQEEYNRLT